ncbi:hypothetical protein [Homoserinibacter sp. GY 40078]|uniref:hypothetical protein n=1 Tax=Homoserinibacter sp. GY 40078 TaxID=2603275 RepID=UPI0011C876AE|nr:hypothetical protein [Homoserinibacter sp. GY 40078]TXK17327.1 hypothetical protein FVQ89_10815 [Homoserinibacter sp. GY 40078]
MQLERAIDLPRAIVWEAFVDPILVTGWLHPSLTLLAADEVVERVPPGPADREAVLHVRGSQFGELRIVLVAVPGGTRGTSTVLRIDGPGLGGDADASTWNVRMDRLQALLRGHPVDWSVG